MSMPELTRDRSRSPLRDGSHGSHGDEPVPIIVVNDEQDENDSQEEPENRDWSVEGQLFMMVNHWINSGITAGELCRKVAFWHRELEADLVPERSQRLSQSAGSSQ